MICKVKFPTQSFVSAFLLCVLFTIAVIICIIHAKAKEDTVLLGLSSPHSSLTSPGGIVTPMSALLVPGDFQLLGKAEEYDAESLFEKINGKAPLYLEEGFLRLYSQRFVHRLKPLLWFEINMYDMAGIENAFSVYSSQKRPNPATYSVFESVHHYKTENGLYFYYGRYYIELVGSTPSSALEQAMIDVAIYLVNSLPVEQTSIFELNLFPLENLVSNSFKISLHNTFGTEVLRKTFTARYLFTGEETTAFISVRKTNESARATLDDYSVFLVNNGAFVLETEDQSTRYFDLYGAIEAFFVHGRHVVGVHEAEDLQTAQKIILQLKRKLGETKRL